jgi:hypothetical protein
MWRKNKQRQQMRSGCEDNDIERLEGDNRGREAYKFIKYKKPILETEVVSLQGQEWQDAARRSKKRWTEHCSGLYTDCGHRDSVIKEKDQISPSPSEDEIYDILYKQVDVAAKRLKVKERQDPGIDDITRGVFKGEYRRIGGS